MFLSKNKKNVYPCTPLFYYIKVGCKGVFVTRTCFRDDINEKIRIKKKSQNIKGYTYKTTHIYAANCPRVENMLPN